MSWNILPGHVWNDASTWNWNPVCSKPPTMVNKTLANGTVILVEGCDPQTSYCDGFQYDLTWQFDEMLELKYPIVFYFLGVAYTFLAIAIICDEFFVPALERICERFDIQPDVAGATLMAAGGSAPELATAFVGTFNESPVGFGTIVGSAVFNVLFVIGACAFAAPDALHLDWWPLFRDSSFYCFALLVLWVFFGFLTPNKIFWYEAILLLLLYVCYVLLMSKSEKLEVIANKLVGKCRKKAVEVPVHPEPEKSPAEGAMAKKHCDEEDNEKQKLVKIGEETEKQNFLAKDNDTEAQLEKEGGDGDDDDDDDEEDEEPFEIEWPKKSAFEHYGKCGCCRLTCARIMFVIQFPLNGLFYITVPDVRRQPTTCCGKTCVWKNWWLPAFSMSIGWILMFAYFMVWWSEILGQLSGLPPSLVGLTWLAAGTSIPDLISSVLVARKGEGNMAVSSSIGSNIFDILIGLPLPWLVYSMKKGIENWGTCTDINGNLDNNHCFAVNVYAQTLFFSVLLLIFMVFLVISIVHCSKWKMTKGLGVSMLVLYFLFLLQDVFRTCEIIESTARWMTWLRSN